MILSLPSSLSLRSPGKLLVKLPGHPTLLCKSLHAVSVPCDFLFHAGSAPLVDSRPVSWSGLLAQGSYSWTAEIPAVCLGWSCCVIQDIQDIQDHRTEPPLIPSNPSICPWRRMWRYTVSCFDCSIQLDAKSKDFHNAFPILSTFAQVMWSCEAVMWLHHDSGLHSWTSCEQSNNQQRTQHCPSMSKALCSRVHTVQ